MTDFERYFEEKGKADYLEVENDRLIKGQEKQYNNMQMLLEKINELEQIIKEHHIFSKSDIEFVLDKLLSEKEIVEKSISKIR